MLFILSELLQIFITENKIDYKWHFLVWQDFSILRVSMVLSPASPLNSALDLLGGLQCLHAVIPLADFKKNGKMGKNI